jgi:glycosyltransferase involved in cell wall biosynthesis
MSQKRVLNQIKYLARDHDVFVTDVVKSKASMTEARRVLTGEGVSYTPVYSEKYGSGFLVNRLRSLLMFIRYWTSSETPQELALKKKPTTQKLISIIETNQINTLIVHYWYQGYLFQYLPDHVSKIIDTHYLVEENIEIFEKGLYDTRHKKRLGRELKHSLQYQHKYFKSCDMIVVNSRAQAKRLKEQENPYKVILAENGQDLTEFIDFHCPIQNDTILFYGALSNQFNIKALKRILSSIYPKILIQMPNIRLCIAGSNPPIDMINHYGYRNVIITGYLSDIKPTIAQSMLMLMPLETASGFRGRAVEVLALGTPIIGTRNALNSIAMENGVHGFILETDDEIVQSALRILNDPILREKMSESCRDLARKYTVEASFGALREGLNELNKLQVEMTTDF